MGIGDLPVLRAIGDGIVNVSTSIEIMGFLEVFAHWIGPYDKSLGIVDSIGEMGFFCVEIEVG